MPGLQAGRAGSAPALVSALASETEIEPGIEIEFACEPGCAEMKMMKSHAAAWWC